MRVVHGARSEQRVAPVARAQRRRFLTRHGLRLSQLDGIASAYLQQWSRLAAKTELIDRYVEEHGLLQADGTPQPCMALYVSLANSQRLALTRLHDALHQQRAEPTASLAAYLDQLDDEGDAAAA